MENIVLHHIMPAVFEGNTNLDSEIWQHEVTFTRGRRYLVSASSGTGKSTLCSYLYGYRDDYSGTIAMDGKDSRSFTVEQWCQLRQRSLAFLHQEMRLFGELTVLENIALKNRITHHKTATQIMQMLTQLGVDDKAHERVDRLSIGQQQRVAIVRSLCQPMDFIILDEPVSHLDNVNNRLVAQLVSDEAAAQGAGVIATSVGNHLLIDTDQLFNL